MSESYSVVLTFSDGVVEKYEDIKSAGFDDGVFWVRLPDEMLEGNRVKHRRLEFPQHSVVKVYREHVCTIAEQKATEAKMAAMMSMPGPLHLITGFAAMEEEGDDAS